MKHDINNSPSYDHMMGSPQPAHMGSQSKFPASKKGSVKDSDSKYDRGHPPGVYQ